MPSVQVVPYLCEVIKAINNLTQRKMKKKIESFDRSNLAEIRKALDEAIQDVCRQYGLNCKGIGNIRFDGKQFKTSLEVFTEAASPKIENDPAAYVGRTFRQKRNDYKILSLSGQYLLAETQNGKKYKMLPEHILNMVEVPNWF